MPPTTPDNQTPVPQNPDTNHLGPVVHTYQDDLSEAMSATDAVAVQKMLETAREREAAEKEAVVVQHQKGWYTTGGIVLIILAIGALLYGIYYYKHLTVAVVPLPSVGVFQTTASINPSALTIQDGITRLTTEDSIPEQKPLLVPIVTNDGATLSPDQTLNYLGISFSEPFMAAMNVVRLGVYNNGTAVSPFLIFSVNNPDVATKEFLIAEPTLLTMLAPLFGIDITNPVNDIATTFNSTYMYNLPVRTLKSKNVDTNIETIVLYYGYATDHTIVVATNPTILKSVYDTIIQQQ